MAVTPLPTLNRLDPDFKAKTDTFFGSQLPTFTSEVNVELARVGNIAFGSYNATSTTSLAIGTGTKTFNVETGKGFVPGQMLMVARTSLPSNYMTGQVTSYNAGTGALVLNVGIFAGSGTYTGWTISVTAVDATDTGIRIASKSSSYTASSADKSALLSCSSTFTLAFDAAATLGAGWFCYLQNAGTGDILLDPNSTETIDGIASFVLYPGAVRLVLCDGTALYSIPIVGGTKTFTTTGSYVWAPGVQQWDADLIAGGAGGGGGARAATRYNGGGGGAGERLLKKIVKSEIVVGGATTCTVGAKGTGGAAAATDNTPANGFVNPGASGGGSSIGTLAVAYAGKATGSGGYTSAHGTGGAGGGQASLSPYMHPASQAYFPGQASNIAVSPGGVYPVTEWGGPSGRAGDSSAAALTATLGGQRGGSSGAAVAAGAAGANGVNPGDGGDGGAGNLNGSAAGKGGGGADGKITIVEVI